MWYFKIILLISLAYLIGSIPFGLIISKWKFGIDIRTKGSGNIGSTNIMRTLGTKWGIIVQLLDILKGTISVVLLAIIIGSNWDILGKFGISFVILKVIIGTAAVLGHIFSCFSGFKGGKGVNTTLGIFLATLPIELIVGLCSFAIVVGLSGFVSLGSIIGSVMLPLVLVIRYNLFNVKITDYFTLIYFVIGISLLLIISHKSNIVKLFKGNENKMEKMMFIKNYIKKLKQM